MLIIKTHRFFNSLYPTVLSPCLTNLLLTLTLVTLPTYAESVDSSYKNILLSDSLVLNDNLFVTGEQGIVQFSKDGEQWELVTTPTQRLITSLSSLGNGSMLAAGHDAIILLSNDSGQNWHEVYEDSAFEAPILDILYLDDQNAIAIGAYGLFLRSTDGGQTWLADSVSILDQAASFNEEGIEPTDLHLNSIRTSSDKSIIAIAVEAGFIFVSKDKGKHWSVIKSPYNGSFFGLEILNNNSILVYGLRGNIYSYNLAKNTWMKINSNTNELLHESYYDNNNSIYIIGYGATLLVSKDNGSSFIKKQLNTKNNFTSISKKEDYFYITHENGVLKIKEEK